MVIKFSIKRLIWLQLFHDRIHMSKFRYASEFEDKFDFSPQAVVGISELKRNEQIIGSFHCILIMLSWLNHISL